MGARRQDRSGSGKRKDDDSRRPEDSPARAEGSHARAEHGDPASRSARPPRSGDAARDRLHWMIVLGAVLVGAAVVYWFSTPREELSSPVREVPELSQDSSAGAVSEFTLPTDWMQWQTHEQFLRGMTQIADQLATRYPSDPMACDLQGRVYAYLGRSAEAQQAWERCLQLDARRPDACLGLAKLAMKRGDDEAAERLLRQAWDIDYTLPEVGLLLAEILTRKNQPDQAAALLTRYVGGVPKSFEGWLQLGQVTLQQGDFAVAQGHFETAVQMRPGSREALVGLGTALLRQGKRDEGRQRLEASQKLQEEPARKDGGMSAEEFDLTRTRVNCAGAILYAAQLCVSHQDLEPGEQLGRMAIGLDAKNLPARQFLMALCEQMGDKESALEVCRETVAADPENPELLWHLGILQFQVGQFSQAADTFRKMIRCAPNEARGYGCLAEVFLETGQDIHEAQRLARESIRLDPAARHYVLLGRICAEMGQFADARSALDEAIRIEPENAEMRAFRDQLPAGAR